MSCTKLPAAVTILDVTTRDGFQIQKEWIPTEFKTAVIDALIAAGVSTLEVASFVSPKAVPQMADAAAIVAHMNAAHPGITYSVLAPNMRGAENARNAGAVNVNYVISASAAHNEANIRRTHEESLNDLAAITETLPDLKVNLSLATVFGCPFSGPVPTKTSIRLIGEGLKRGVTSVTLADTIGVGNPLQVRAVLRSVLSAFPDLDIRLHMPDTHGMGLANMAAALEEGITVFETAAGGLGGCPFAPGAAGNTATEDAVNMFHRMGVATGINLEAYLSVVGMIRENIDAPLPGRFATARSFKEYCFFDPKEAY
ncbi:MAG: Hydroxymethylglutaryl-CoA lyase YngG [Desulfovibrio sp.]